MEKKMVTAITTFIIFRNMKHFWYSVIGRVSFKLYNLQASIFNKKFSWKIKATISLICLIYSNIDRFS